MSQLNITVKIVTSLYLDMSERIFNFSAGPATVPLPCLERAAAEMTNWKGTGMSVIECSHRSKPWEAEMNETRDRVRRLLNIPENFEILLLAGGAQLQFSAIPFNILGDYKKVDFLVTGQWSKKAYEEIKRLNFPGVEPHLVAPMPAANPIDVPERSTWNLSEDAAYFYYCENETIQGIQFKDLPDVPAPLVIDASSDFLSRPITQWEKIGLIYACAQKNFGVAGMTIVVVRKDLLERPLKPFCPITLDYRTQVKNGCLYNTPPSFAIYFANHVFKWIEEQGGVEAVSKKNEAKAAKLYKAIDDSPHFVNRIKPEWRSLMNIPFFRPDGYEVKKPDVDMQFINMASSHKCMTIKGHVSVGGFRASIYNAMTEEGIDALCSCINTFEGFKE